MLVSYLTIVHKMINLTFSLNLLARQLESETFINAADMTELAETCALSK